MRNYLSWKNYEYNKIAKIAKIFFESLVHKQNILITD